jgi:preprotein translocase subunit SecE
MAEQNDKDVEREHGEAAGSSDEPASDDDRAMRAFARSLHGDDDGSQKASAGDESEGRDDDGRGAARLAARERRQMEREERELAEVRQDPDGVPLSGLLGLERWVQFSFVALGVLVFYLGDALIAFVWQFFAEPDPTIVSGSALILGVLTAFSLYRHAPVHQFVSEVVGELSKVTWPTRDETYHSTVVVIITSVIAAVYTGLFDALWSAFTDLIYNV